MRGWVVLGFTLVVRHRDDLAAYDDHRTHRNLANAGGLFCGSQGRAHVHFLDDHRFRGRIEGQFCSSRNRHRRAAYISVLAA
jgi:hypothetical protein